MIQVMREGGSNRPNEGMLFSGAVKSAKPCIHLDIRRTVCFDFGFLSNFAKFASCASFVVFGRRNAIFLVNLRESLKSEAPFKFKIRK